MANPDDRVQRLSDNMAVNAANTTFRAMAGWKGRLYSKIINANQPKSSQWLAGMMDLANPPYLSHDQVVCPNISPSTS